MPAAPRRRAPRSDARSLRGRSRAFAPLPSRPPVLRSAIAQSEAWLIASRAVRGLGAAIVSPAALSIITTTFEDVLHFSAIKTGLSYLPLAVGIIISAGVGSQLVTRIGFKPVLIAGLLLIAGALVWFSQVPAPGGSFSADVLGPSLLAAFGLGFSFVSVTVGAVLGTEPGEAGLASGLINTSEQVGGAIGLAILATVANSRTQGLLSEGVHPSVALTKGFDRAFLVGAGFAIAGAILAAVLISSRDSREQAEAARRGELDAGAVSGTPTLAATGDV